MPGKSPGENSERFSFFLTKLFSFENLLIFFVTVGFFPSPSFGAPFCAPLGFLIIQGWSGNFLS
jgi:hypothetical protein